MYSRAKYKDAENSKSEWQDIVDPIASKKYDGAHFYLEFDHSGRPRFISRRESVKPGVGYPDRTEKLPHLASIVLPSKAGHVYNVELIHTGQTKDATESHPAISGILNSLPEKAIFTQTSTGPVRAVIIDVVNPKLDTFREKITEINSLVNEAGKPDIMFAPEFIHGIRDINNLIKNTESSGDEGIIVTSGSIPENNNVRIKIKHRNTYNLRVGKILQEFDIKGNPKKSAGALALYDRTGTYVGNVGTGFTRDLRKEIYNNPHKFLDKIIQVVAMKPTAHKIRSAVYNGFADGEIDTI